MSFVAAYLERFEELLNDVGGQSEASLISFFIGGLKLDLRCELDIIQPTSLWKAFFLAKLYEVQWSHGKRDILPTAIELRLKTPLDSPKSMPILRKMLTVEERKERSAKGLYFNCDDLYVLGHKCK